MWAERLEKLAFNALPAALSDDMWSHQYDQMTNQIACYRQPGKPIYGTNFADANMFGLEPNFGCCTSNFNQGWPKLTMHGKTFMMVMCMREINQLLQMHQLILSQCMRGVKSI